MEFMSCVDVEFGLCIVNTSFCNHIWQASVYIHAVAWSVPCILLSCYLASEAVPSQRLWWMGTVDA